MPKTHHHHLKSESIDLVRRGAEPLRDWVAEGLASARVHRNPSTSQLYEMAIARREGRLSEDGALVCLTGPHTGRSPRDKFIVRESSSDAHLWWGSVNRPLDEAHYELLERDVADYLRDRDLFIQDLAAGADPGYRLPVCVVTELAWHSLFARNLLRGAHDTSDTALTIIAAPGFKASPTRHGTRSETCIAINLARRRVIIAGTAYAGEIKKSVFTVLNYLLPFQDVLPMHCSANVGADRRVALFFGLSGTGKTTLSSDPARRLIGDDEHGWSGSGVFNFEGGCYAKTVRLSQKAEPQIWSATRRYGAVLENVVMDPASRRVDFDADTLTENTRAAYPIDFIDVHEPSGAGGHPTDVVMLTADAFGVMPPIARLTPSQAMYHFLSGYTARVAGTERGITEPAATFSACFGAPFLPLRPSVYASFLGRRLAQHASRVWLVNTGWTGGPAGEGERMPLRYTRAMIGAALDGQLDRMPTSPDPIFGVDVPRHCPGVPDALLDPRSTWREPASYDAQARRLASMFAENSASFASDVAPDVASAGPRA
jgi:phosphoenolpyruvate carboxykinase (ATP)